MPIDLSLILSCLAVCAAKTIEVTINSMKTILVVKGKKYVAALLGFAENLLWGLVISSVITTLNENFLMLFAYAFGYALGMLLGSTIESKIALGTSCIQIMVKKSHVDVVEKYLRNHERGFTVLEGTGSKENMNIIVIVLPRKEVKYTMETIRKLCDNEVFVVASDVNKYSGGYGVRR